MEPVEDTCLVLGAGASLAHAQFFRPRRNTSTHPPLDYTFFEKIRALSIPVPTELNRYAANLPGPNPFRADAPAIRMEEFLKDLFYDFRQGPRSAAATAYMQILQIYTAVLRQTTNWLGSDGRTGGPVGRLISDLLESTDNLVIVTFNQDLVIENEIVKRARLRRHWCVEEGYGTVGQVWNVTSPNVAPKSLLPEHTLSCDHGTKSLFLLKLHGSLNWYYRLAGKVPTPGALSGQTKSTRLFITRRREIPANIRYNLGGSGPGRKTWYTWPVVVPPVYEKHAIISAYLNDVWRDARNAARVSDRLVFVGYSFPELDIEAERFFQRAVADNSVARFVDVVNPAPECAERYARLFPTLPLRLFRSIDEFLVSMSS